MPEDAGILSQMGEKISLIRVTSTYIRLLLLPLAYASVMTRQKHIRLEVITAGLNDYRQSKSGGRNFYVEQIENPYQKIAW